MSDVRVIHGDCLAVLRTLPDASVDSIVTDPPYGLADHRPAELVTALTAWVNGDRERVPDGKGFMGKAWDAFVPPPAVWDECLRVLKPGGHLVAFAGSRTYDLMGLSIRLAGFEIRDGLQWLYGSGFPKGQDVGKAIDATLLHGGANSRRIKEANASRPGEARTRTSTMNNGIMGESQGEKITRDEPATPDAARWDGWNTSLKPAHEPIVLARKPLPGTVAATVLEHGTGALNVDGCRVAHASSDDLAVSLAKNPGRTDLVTSGVYGADRGQQSVNTAGRWPTNVLLSHDPECDDQCAPGCPVAELDEQSGTTTSKSGGLSTKALGVMNDDAWIARDVPRTGHDDRGGASRFFPSFRYQAKAPKAERPKVDGVAHPTVKPLALMAWLVRLLTPPGGVVLDPFAGSGTTLQAARDEGMASIGIERDPTYLPLIAARLGLDAATFEQADDEGAGDAGVGKRDPGGEPGLPLRGHGDSVGDGVPTALGGDPAGRETVRGAGVPERVAPGGAAVIDFAALGTGMDIRQALDVLEARSEADTSPEAAQAVAVVRAGLEELEQRLNTARRTAWVAVPIAWREMRAGDVIVGKDGTLLVVLATDQLYGMGNQRVQVPPDRWLETADPDRPVPVLRRPSADALDILTRQLGAQVITKK